MSDMDTMHAQDESKHWLEQAKWFEEKLSAAEAALSEANKVIDQLKQQGCPIEAELAEAQNQRDCLATKIIYGDQQLQQLEAQVAQLQQQVGDEELSSAKAWGEVDSLKLDVAQLQARLTQRGLDIASVCEERAQLQATIGELNEEHHWQPMETAPLDGITILVNFGRCGVHAVSWEESVCGTTGWCVDDRKHGPYPLRGYLETDIRGWMYLPSAALANVHAEEKP